jgi:N-acetylmuramoyl-L-alanine amidase
MKIEQHQLVAGSNDFDITIDNTPNVSREFSFGLPDTIIIHYTGGASLSSSVSWLKNPAAKASAHLVVGKKGEVVQLAPFNIKTWHAGESTWKNRSWLNNYSIGIEIDNAGALEQRVDGYYTNYGKKITDKNVVLASHKHQDVVRGWEAYTDKQLDAVQAICIELIAEYPIIEILGHEDISPGRKIDPGPAFPLKGLRDKVLLGRSDHPVSESTIANNIGFGIVTADYLNIRTNPSLDSLKVTNPLAKGTKVVLQETVGNWSRVRVDIEGWVNKDWLKIIE